MSDYTPIPIPLRLRWRYFRTRFLPAIVFAAAVIAAALVWEKKSLPAVMVGEVYAPHGIVAASVPGIIEEFNLQLYHEVRAGDVIGRVRTVPAGQAGQALAALRAEIAMIKLGAGDPVLDQQRNALSWHALRRDWMLARSELALLRVQRRQAELEFRRFQTLEGSGAASQTDFEQSRSLVEGLTEEEEEKEKLTAYLERAVSDATSAAGEEPFSLESGMTASLDWKEAELALREEELKPVPLVAPFDGRVTVVHRRQGDFVNLGEAVIEVGASRPDFIIGYVKQPVSVPLEVGMEIEVAKRSGVVNAARASLVSIGPRFETLGGAFQRPVPVIAEERALPLLISLPEGLPLRPGEIVDLRLAVPEA
jgi:multidrug resistance efflux pump